jgi:hypothetical protein
MAMEFWRFQIQGDLNLAQNMGVTRVSWTTKNMITDALSEWRDTQHFIRYLNEFSDMDWSWLSAELATVVTGRHPPYISKSNTAYELRVNGERSYIVKWLIFNFEC